MPKYLIQDGSECPIVVDNDDPNEVFAALDEHVYYHLEAIGADHRPITERELDDACKEFRVYGLIPVLALELRDFIRTKSAECVKASKDYDEQRRLRDFLISERDALVEACAAGLTGLKERAQRVKQLKKQLMEMARR